jgi:YVTN family beta-propeller protein
VFDVASNIAVATVDLGFEVEGGAIAVTPDGKHAYVATSAGVAVIDTTTNTVVAGVPVGGTTSGVAVTPDGTKVYVTQLFTGISVINTATNKVGATVPIFGGAIAVAPNGQRAYVTNLNDNTTSVIDTANNKVVATILVGGGAIAVTPDGKHVYVTNLDFFSVSVIDTASNTVATTVPVVNGAVDIAITPDGKKVYVAGGSVSVLNTTSNIVVATVAVPNSAVGIAIMPPPAGVPFLAFNAELQIDIDRDPKRDAFALESSFTLSSIASNGIHPLTEPVTLQVGTLSITIPPGSFRNRENENEDEGEHEDGFFTFHGVIDGVQLKALIKRTGTLRYAFHAKAKGANLTGTNNPVQVTLTIGDDTGTASVTARIR